ncbi:MAG: hypothetical protein A3H91_06690 [Gammaproteobacteria bacterium RIFCSPLOWO2_02_FULL_61_13]|nr:MAG: hypothetical protein A3H91_06690 [Gammaproteobacteria bacterium RIFCSPLOWO2_02_FULL_61_13]
MQANGAGPRALARAFTPAEVRRTLFCVICSAIITLSGCETPSLTRPDAVVPLEDIASLTLQADQAYQGADWPAAESGYRRLTQLAPENAEHWFRLGNVYAHLNIFGEAVRMYGEALRRNDAHVDAWHNLGMAQMQLAARSFVQLQARTPADDPARDRARRLVEGVTEVLESEQSDGQDTEP